MIIIGIILVLFGSLISLLNWWYLYMSISQKRHVSSIPLFGGLFLALGLYCLTRSIYSFFGIFADYGTIICFWAIPYLVQDTWQTSTFRLSRRLTGKFKNAIYTLKLFKGGVFVMKIDFDPPQVCNEHGAEIISSGMQGNWQQDAASIILKEYRDGRKTVLTKIDDSTYLSKELNCPEDKQYKYNSLDNIEWQIA